MTDRPDNAFGALQGQRVLLLGLGQSGLAMARWCARHGAAVRAWDSRLPTAGADAPAELQPQLQALRSALPQAELLPGALDASALDGVQRVLKSPGLAPLDERIAPLLAAAGAAGIAVQGELQLWAQALAELKAAQGYAPRVLAVTGTNGKTTTTALTARLVQSAGLAWPWRATSGRRCWTRWRRRWTPPLRPSRSRCPRSGCWSCPASSSTASTLSSRMRPRC